MKKVILAVSIFALSVILSSCSDAQRGKLMAYGSGAKVTCWSGSEKIYDGFSTGKVQSEEQSDGYYFVDEASGDTMEVSGNCVIIYK